MNEPVNVFFETTVAGSFCINRLEDTNINPVHPIRLTDHRILLIDQGTGTLSVDNREFSIEGSELFLISKGQFYAYGQSVAISGYDLSFGDCFWEKAPASASNCKAVLFNNAAANQHIRLSSRESGELSLLFNALLKEFQMPVYLNQADALAAFLKIIMIKIANVKLTEESTFDNNDYLLYRQFMELLSSNFKSYREVSQYAGLLGIAPRRLSAICKRCHNKTAKEIIAGQIIAEAKRLLQFTASSIKEIAYQFNFHTPEQFSHFFKKNTGFSPVDYRNAFLNLGASSIAD